jgi:hypothetical protein
MFSKRVTAAFWDNDLSPSMMLKVSSFGPEKAQLQKIGSDITAFGLDIQPEKGFTYVHVITN